MKPYLVIWRDAAAAPTCHRIVIAATLTIAMGIAEKDPQGHHASFHILGDYPETRAAIVLAHGTPRKVTLFQPGAEAKISWAFQEDLAVLYGTTDPHQPVRAARWAFTCRRVWQDAQALVDKIWPRGPVQERGPRLVYSLDAGLHHMQHWDVPLENYDLTFPHSAPMVTPETEA